MNEVITPVYFEQILLKFLFTNKDVRDKILSYMNVEIFDDALNISIIKKAMSLFAKYEKFPSVTEMKIAIDDEKIFKRFFDEIINIDLSDYNDDYLLSEIETFFKKKMLSNICADTAIGISGELSKLHDMPDKMREVLAFGFDTNVGLDLLADGDRIYNALHNRDKTISTGISNLDILVEGGFHHKSLSLFLAASNVGKTLMMCSIATNNILQNKNVLYVTAEMSEEKISERILANMFDIEIEMLKTISRQDFDSHFAKINHQIKNKLIVKEYPTKAINTNHLRNLLKELKIKKGFVPDVMYVDYLALLNSVHNRKTDNTYSEVKRITEELRGLAVEYKLPIVSALQGNRSSFGDAEIELDQVADSIGTVQTADLIIGISQSEEYQQMGKYSLIILKNRYGINNRKLAVNVDYFKMRVFEDSDAKVDIPIASISSVAVPNNPMSNQQKADNIAGVVTKVQNIIDNNENLKKNKFIDFE